MMNGVFLTLEGPEGSGKSSHTAALAAALRAQGREVVCVREPGGTAVGEAVRAILQHNAAGEAPCPETETLLYAASRAQLVRCAIRPALQRGCCVIADRFLDSSMAYQGYGRGFGVDRVLAANELAVDGAMPDLTLLLDVPADVGLARIRRRNRERGAAPDRMEREDAAFHGRVRQGYLELARRWPERIRVIDSTPPFDAVCAAIRAAVEPLLKARKEAGDAGG